MYTYIYIYICIQLVYMRPSAESEPEGGVIQLITSPDMTGEIN